MTFLLQSSPLGMGACTYVIGPFSLLMVNVTFVLQTQLNQLQISSAQLSPRGAGPCCCNTPLHSNE